MYKNIININYLEISTFEWVGRQFVIFAHGVQANCFDFVNSFSRFLQLENGMSGLFHSIFKIDLLLSSRLLSYSLPEYRIRYPA